MNLPENLNLDIQITEKKNGKVHKGLEIIWFFTRMRKSLGLSLVSLKKTGLDSFEVSQHLANLRVLLIHAYKVLDLGCGIGRHVKYAYEMQLDAYGIDLSDTAISIARSWLKVAV